MPKTDTVKAEGEESEQADNQSEANDLEEEMVLEEMNAAYAVDPSTFTRPLTAPPKMEQFSTPPATPGTSKRRASKKRFLEDDQEIDRLLRQELSTGNDEDSLFRMNYSYSCCGSVVYCYICFCLMPGCRKDFSPSLLVAPLLRST